MDFLGAAGNIWCPNKVSKILKTAPGLVVIFVKKADVVATSRRW
jgi:hypothetical protein